MRIIYATTRRDSVLEFGELHRSPQIPKWNLEISMSPARMQQNAREGEQGAPRH